MNHCLRATVCVRQRSRVCVLHLCGACVCVLKTPLSLYGSNICFSDSGDQIHLLWDSSMSDLCSSCMLWTTDYMCVHNLSTYSTLIRKIHFVFLFLLHLLSAERTSRRLPFVMSQGGGHWYLSWSNSNMILHPLRQRCSKQKAKHVSVWVCFSSFSDKS